jgi:hypothetical protein
MINGALRHNHLSGAMTGGDVLNGRISGTETGFGLELLLTVQLSLSDLCRLLHAFSILLICHLMMPLKLSHTPQR